MKTKLTLSIEENIVEAAKEIAKESGTSLSQMIENNLRLMSRKKVQKTEANGKSSIVEKLRGCAKLGDDRDYKEIVSEEMMKKYERLK